MSEALPQMFGPYRVVRLIGEGGMGRVYEAVHTQIERRAAIKVLNPHLAGDPMLATRFLNEARAVNLVSHPSMVTASDFGTQSGVPYIVMEFLEGETLAERLRHHKGQPVPAAPAMQILRQIAAGLDHAHGKGIIHRDLKPTNLMLIRDAEVPGGERVKILDFGIAKFLEPEEHDKHLTATNTLLGTPLFMSPEQCRSARDVSDRSDIYALGVLAYFMLTGVHPFLADNDMDIILLHATHTPPALRELVPSTPAELDELVMHMLRKTPSERPSARQVAQVLSHLLAQMGRLAPSSASQPPPPTSTQSQNELLVDRAMAPTQVKPAQNLNEARTAVLSIVNRAQTLPSAEEDTRPPQRDLMRKRMLVLAAVSLVLIVGAMLALITRFR